MTIPLWTLLVATLLPYVWFSLANPLRKQEFGALDNRHPRIQERAHPLRRGPAVRSPAQYEAQFDPSSMRRSAGIAAPPSPAPYRSAADSAVPGALHRIR